jgi:hypothetical protein
MSADNVQRNPALNVIPGLVDTLLDLYRLISKALNNDGKVVLQNTLYVAKNGNNATALRNRLDKPFLTVQAAVNASLPGDVIHVFPGQYAEEVILPTFPTVMDLTIEGDAPVNDQRSAATIIDGGVLPALFWANGAGNVALANISLVRAVGDSLFVTGDVGSTRTELSVENVFASQFHLDRLSSINITDLRDNSAATSRLIDCGSMDVDGLRCRGDLSVRYNQATSTASMVRGGYRFTDARVSGVMDLNGHPNVVCDGSCHVDGGITGSFTYNIAPALAPSFVFSGTSGSNVNLSFPSQTGIPRSFCDFSGANVTGQFACSAVPSLIPTTVVAAGSKFSNGVVAGDAIAMDIRGTTVPQLLMACAGTGTLDRDSHSFSGEVVSAIGGSLLPFLGIAATPIPFPLGAAYAVTDSTINATNPVGVLLKTQFNFTAVALGPGAATADFTVTRL